MHSSPELFTQIFLKATVSLSCKGGRVVVLKSPLSTLATSADGSAFKQGSTFTVDETNGKEDSLSFVLPEVHVISHQTKLDVIDRLPRFLPVLASVDGQILGKSKVREVHLLKRRYS